MGKSFKLRNGLLLLSTEAPGGVYNASQLKKIAALCEGDSAIAKATEDQRIAIFAAPEKAAQIAKELRAVGLGVRHYQDGLHQPVNCIGELCGEHQQDAMGASMDLARSLGGIVLTAAPLKIGINGCGRCCVPTHTLDISVVGEAQGYRLSLGGRNAQLPELATYIAEGIPPAELPDLLTKVVNLYKGLAQPGESLQAVLERCGSRPFLEALAPYSQDGFGADSLDLGGESLGSDPNESSLDADSPIKDSPVEDLQDVGTHELDESSLDMEMEQESPAIEYQEIPDEQLIVAPEATPKSVSGSSERISPQQKNSKSGGEKRDLPPSIPDLQHDLMDELPGFDPSLEGGDASSGPTIDGLDLAGDGHGAIGLEPELLGDELPQEESLPRLDDRRETENSAVNSAGLEIQDDLEQDLSLPEGPIAPVEDDFDAQQALSDDFDEQPTAEAVEDSNQVQDDVSLEAVAGLDPIEDIASDIPIGKAALEQNNKGSSLAETLAKNASPVAEEFEAEKGAEVVEGSDADELEAKLAASIAAEESLVPIEDENAAARLEAMSLISGESLPSSDTVESALDVPEDFSDLQIDAEPMMEPDVLEAPDIDVDDFELEDFADGLEHNGDQSPSAQESVEEDLASQRSIAEPPTSLSKPGSSPGLRAAPTPPSMKDEEGEPTPKGETPRASDIAEDTPSNRSPGPTPASVRKEPSNTVSTNGFSLSGIDLIDGGRVALAFASGMSLVVDPRTIAPGMTKGFNFGGQRINITAADRGLNVEVDGVTIFLPVAA